MSGMDDFEAYRAAARAGGVPDEAVELALGLARPQVELSSSPGPDAVLAGRYGGWPSLPAEVEWEGYPDFVASVDCAALPRVFDFPFPAEGSLLFFADRRDAEGPESERGAGFVVYVGADAVVEERVPEDGEAVYGEPVPLFARSLWSLPMACDDVVAADERVRGVYGRYRLDRWDERRGVAQVELLLGGYAYSPQDPPSTEGGEWVLLAQGQYGFRDEPDFVGCPFWSVRRGDLEVGDFSSAWMVMWSYH